jgi:hypothetical protein
MFRLHFFLLLSLSFFIFSCIKVKEFNNEFDNQNVDPAYDLVVGKWISIESYGDFKNLHGSPYFFQEYRYNLELDERDTMILNADRTYKTQVNFVTDCYMGGKFRIDSSSKMTMHTTISCDTSTLPNYTIEDYNFSISGDSMILFRSFKQDSFWTNQYTKLYRIY